MHEKEKVVLRMEKAQKMIMRKGSLVTRASMVTKGDFDNAHKCKVGTAHIQNPRYWFKSSSYKLNDCYSKTFVKTSR